MEKCPKCFTLIKNDFSTCENCGFDLKFKIYRSESYLRRNKNHKSFYKDKYEEIENCSPSTMFQVPESLFDSEKLKEGELNNIFIVDSQMTIEKDFPNSPRLSKTEYKYESLIDSAPPLVLEEENKKKTVSNERFDYAVYDTIKEIETNNFHSSHSVSSFSNDSCSSSSYSSNDGSSSSSSSSSSCD